MSLVAPLAAQLAVHLAVHLIAPQAALLDPSAIDSPELFAMTAELVTKRRTITKAEWSVEKSADFAVYIY